LFVGLQTANHNNIWPLGTTVTINAVMTAMVAKSASGGPIVEMMHLLGGAEIHSSVTLSTSDTFYSYLWPTIPSLLDLNGSEVGIFRHAGSTAQTTLEDCWLQVDYSGGLLPAARTQLVLIQ
jgi:hypothetical protein